MIKITTTIQRKGNAKEAIEKIVKALKEGPAGVKVGFPQGDSPQSVINRAYWNHEGTSRAKGEPFKTADGKFGISGPIPPRPFITVAMFHGRQEIKTAMRNEAARVMRGEITMPIALSHLGILGQGLIQRQIRSGVGPPNSPMTIFLKGTGKNTLNDSGIMGGSVSWELYK
jgi:hypothetical protein